MMKYTFMGNIAIGFNLLLTRLFFPKSRIIRFPIDIRGKKNIDFGIGLTTGYHCRLETHQSSSKNVLTLGKNVQINDFVHIAAMDSVVIGDNVLIASKVFITDILHGSYKGDDADSDPETPPKDRLLSASPVHIGDNVWIGEFVSILPGCTIGNGSVVGSNSVVTKDIPAYSIAVGNPAKIIKRFNSKTQHWEKA